MNLIKKIVIGAFSTVSIRNEISQKSQTKIVSLDTAQNQEKSTQKIGLC